jgi:bifunctional non-homologous end joining protein LigD
LIATTSSSSLNYDGVRAVAYIEDGQCRLVSRNGNTFRQFTDLCARITDQYGGNSVILDGEIVCLDGDGRPLFDDLFRRRGQPCFAAFDLLHLDRADLRGRTLLERKAELRQFATPGGPVMYVDHVRGEGRALFEEICRRDLEGIIAKWAHGLYDPDAAHWYKIKNPSYSRMAERWEMLQRRRCHYRLTEKLFQ